MNKIAKIGTDNFDPAKYTIGEEIDNPSALLVRSADLHEFDFPATVKAVARAGAGVNNIPLDKCADQAPRIPVLVSSCAVKVKDTWNAC